MCWKKDIIRCIKKNKDKSKIEVYGYKKRTGQHPSFSLTKPIKLIKPKLMN